MFWGARNAATNVIFPVVTLISALSLMCGVGSSNSMNMNRGNGNMEMARRCVDSGLGLAVVGVANKVNTLAMAVVAGTLFVKEIRALEAS